MSGKPKLGLWRGHPHPTSSHVVFVCLTHEDRTVATIEAFSIHGPWYANAMTQDGDGKRLGPGISLEKAVEWCEQTTGVVSRLPRKLKDGSDVLA